MNVTPDQIQQLVKTIAEQFHPDRIVLFGSRARGMAREHSDVDLLVVLPCEGSPLDLALAMLEAADPRYAVDLIVRTPEEVRWRYEQGDPIIREAFDHGVVMYEKAA